MKLEGINQTQFRTINLEEQIEAVGGSTVLVTEKRTLPPPPLILDFLVDTLTD